MNYRWYKRIFWKWRRKIKRKIFGLCIFLGLIYILNGCASDEQTVAETTVSTTAAERTEQTSQGSEEEPRTTETSQTSQTSDAIDVSSATIAEDEIEVSPVSSSILSEIPPFDGTRAWVEVNGNVPSFTKSEIQGFSYEQYAPLDDLGRCGAAIASIGVDLMPTEERGEIGQIKPSGWHTVKYSDYIDQFFCYNRCHLIAYQLTGENANEKNLITGTRFLNIDGMLPWENKVANFLREHEDAHVIYKVTPIYDGDNLLASGVLMKAQAIGEGIDWNDLSFCVYCYNAQPGVSIDYATGETEWTGEYYEEALKHGFTSVISTSDTPEEEAAVTYILNTNSHKIHRLDCDSINDIKDKNKKETTLSKEELEEMGYEPCQRCNP